jgi:peptidoglycan/xylan/chitin deacetylase (PgdA/CDA1 family)
VTPSTPAADTGEARGNPGYRWRPAPVVRFSILLHAAALAAAVVQPGLWPWALGAVVANHLLLSTAMLWPRGQLLGANVVRLPATAIARKEVSLTFDDGPDAEVTPRVLDLLDRYGAKASFFCVGEKLAAHADMAKEIVRRGHSIENHSLRHSHAFPLYGYFRMAREVSSAQAILARHAGRAPQFFRAPMGLRSPLLDPVFARSGLRCVSWTRRGLDTVDRNAHRVLRRLAGGLDAGDILLLHDGGSARTRDDEPVVLIVLPLLLELIASKGLRPVPLPAALGDGSAT